ncbi:TonB-dependent receptor [Gilvimarinus agarilyticus]|uniref:TonB-dependent receptor n=1 Tax=Gilvimarinus sp. 2_MG-2023 TaxID=3062666 RepID=UPI001C080692|nr:TonB-dependent receptor [Gilvimarinus sp. 2_MG-2023]MBU2887442.1 TonB-dependent receptor [Gilvimarinus agarilyticus]MDO6572101.1 TonB-dependent receptor [Gilvimarinus sp. 2_MG-2023]
MKKTILSTTILSALFVGTNVNAEEFVLAPINVVGDNEHKSQTVQKQVEQSLNGARTISEVSGGVVQNLNAVNKLDGLRYHATGLINSPWGGDRFGGTTKIRTFGDWGASESIDGLPAFRSSGQEGGGFAHTLIPSIAISTMQVRKGGQAVQYGNGTDGGVLQTNIKSGQGYDNHAAISLDASNIKEAQLQAEAADSSESWDYYVAGKYFDGEYNGEPANLDSQQVQGAVGKFGWNASEATRAEFMLIYDRSTPDVIRNGEVQAVQTHSQIGSIKVDHSISENNSLEAGVVANHSHAIWSARNRDRSTDNTIGFINYFHNQSINDTLTYSASAGLEAKQTQSTRDGQWDNQFDDYSVIIRNGISSDKFLLTVGLRQAWFNNDIVLNGEQQIDNLASDNALGYELTAAYNVAKNTRVRVSASSGYNRYIEKYGNFGADALNTTGAGDEVVESDTIEVGIKHTFSSGSFDIAIYNTVQNNVPRRNSGAIESMEVDQAGLEAEVFSAITQRLTLSAGYMHLIEVDATRADGTKVNGNIFWDGQVVSVPKNQFNLRANYFLSDHIQLWSANYYSTGYEAVAADGEIVKNEAFARLDLGVNWQVANNWNLRARAENILDEHNFGSTIEGVPSTDDGKIGRVIWFGVDHQF